MADKAFLQYFFYLHLLYSFFFMLHIAISRSLVCKYYFIYDRVIAVAEAAEKKKIWSIVLFAG
jgi:hypothetical protein